MSMGESMRANGLITSNKAKDLRSLPMAQLIRETTLRGNLKAVAGMSGKTANFTKVNGLTD